jgi:hypothetical protein
MQALDMINLSNQYLSQSFHAFKWYIYLCTHKSMLLHARSRPNPHVCSSFSISSLALLANLLHQDFLFCKLPLKSRLDKKTFFPTPCFHASKWYIYLCTHESMLLHACSRPKRHACSSFSISSLALLANLLHQAFFFLQGPTQIKIR